MAQTQATPIYANRKRLFDSVFPPVSLDDFRPTPGDKPTEPEASERPRNTRASSRRSAALNNNYYGTPGPSNPAWPDPVIWDRAWRASTTFLAIPDKGFEVLAEFENEENIDEVEILEQWNRYDSLSKEIADALAYVVRTGSVLGWERKRGDGQEQDLLQWYELEIRRHFLRNFRGGLLQLLDSPEEDVGVLHKIVGHLQIARKIYFAPLLQFLLPLLDSAAQESAFLRFQRGFHGVVAYSLPWFRISALLSRELTKEAIVVLGIDTLCEDEDENGIVADDMDIDRRFSVSYSAWRIEPSTEARMRMMTESEDVEVIAARDRLLSLLRQLQLVGLGGDRAQIVFAGVMHEMMALFIQAAYTGQWEGQTLVPQHLRHWIESLFARLVVQVLAIINAPETGTKAQDRLDVGLTDVTRWQEIGIARLGALRVSELFDVIVEWPTSVGAIEDLRHFTTHTASRAHLTISFTAALNQRLLHPGASTVEILQVYISIIRAFSLLDPKGVLLDRVARPIRRYLRERDDTIKAVVGGLLADPADATAQPAPSNNETLVELATELVRAHHQSSLRDNTGELDWDDMNWMPDPIDAAPDYRKSKAWDVVGSLISLFDSKETFVREMQNMLAERLIRKRADFDQELSVLELLKIRFGDSALQACEVMLRDIVDSRRVDTVVRGDQGLVAETKRPAAAVGSPMETSAGKQDIPELHAKILSRFFWPQFKAQDFKIPDEVNALQQRYAAGFESLKQCRKLSWLNGLGQVTVELDLEDRVFVDEVTTWQASVIYAFQSEPDTSTNTNTNTNEPTTLTIADLSQKLHMAIPLVRSACLFWVSKRVLTETSRDTFSVLEVLPADDGQDSTGATDQPTDARGGHGGNNDQAAADATARAAAAEAAAAQESADAAAMEKMNLYWQFIVGMLTNQGAMPLQRIAMMLKLVVPAGFPFSNEELREFLAGMVARGRLEVGSGGVYRIVQG